MSDIVEFLRARLDEDEQIAKRAAGSGGIDGRWAYDGDSAHGEVYRPDASRTYTRIDGSTGVEHSYVTQDSEGIMSSVEGDDGTHIARHDPARVLREVEAKRRIITLAEQVARSGAEFAEQDFDTLTRSLAVVYSDHPDYQQEWAIG
ncbi:hypothetical protein GS490_13460 [Rhodococcus hoagii]|nr:hypothetical protein [Prescottella equi]